MHGSRRNLFRLKAVALLGERRAFAGAWKLPYWDLVARVAFRRALLAFPRAALEISAAVLSYAQLPALGGDSRTMRDIAWRRV